MSNDKRYETEKLTDGISDVYGAEANEQSVVKKKPKKVRFNFLILIVSFLISVSIWLYVMSTENEDYEKTINLIPVQLIGTVEMENNHNMSIVSGYNNTVAITIKGKRSEVEKYTASDIYAYVDVGKMENRQRQPLPVNVDALEGVSISLITPADISVYADVIDTRDVEVIVKPTLSIEEPYYKGEITQSVKTVRVTGPSSVLEDIGYALAEFDAGKPKASIDGMTSIYLMDKKGKKISNPYISMDENVTNIRIQICSKKNIKLTYTYDEKAFEDYIVEIKLDFDSIWVGGDALEIAQFEKICVFEGLTLSHFKLDDDGNHLPFEKDVPIELPEGFKFMNSNASTTVKITAEITKKVPDIPPDTDTQQPENTTSPETTENTPTETQSPVQ